MLSIVYNPDKKILQKLLAKKLTESIRLACENGNTLFLFSGGSAFEIYPNINFDTINLKNLSIMPLDERFSKDNANIETFKHLPLYLSLKDRVKMITGIEDFSKKPQQVAENTDTFLHTCIQQKYHLISVLGMGLDGHVSGIMPFPESPATFDRLFMDPNHYACFYDATGKNEFALRITTTIPFLQKINETFAYITGEEKAIPLQKALERKEGIEELPCRIIHSMQQVFLYTDITSVE